MEPPSGYIVIRPGPNAYNRDCADIAEQIRVRLDPTEQMSVRDGDPRELAREAAVAKMNSIYSGQIPDEVSRRIADAVVDALLGKERSE
jgi:hypothetical protein